jgi:hypothetical protein
MALCNARCIAPHLPAMQTVYHWLVLRDIICGACPDNIDIFKRVCPH